MQNFERYPRLAQYIERMASTGKTGNTHEWCDFLMLLNAALDDERKRKAPCERFCEATAFNSEIKRLRGAIRRFCEQNKDIPQDSDVIKELFYISMQ